MDRKRAELVELIQQALAAAKAADKPMCEYMLELALTEALVVEREATELGHKGFTGAATNTNDFHR